MAQKVNSLKEAEEWFLLNTGSVICCNNGEELETSSYLDAKAFFTQTPDMPTRQLLKEGSAQ